MKTERKKVLLILDWCIDKFGVSHYEPEYPSLSVYNSKGSTIDKKFFVAGTYNAATNRITIYLGSIKNYEKLCDTMLHEYKHYLLSSLEYTKEYYKLKKKFTDSEMHDVHPHEIECRKFGRKWNKECFDDLKKELRKRT